MVNSPFFFFFFFAFLCCKYVFMGDYFSWGYVTLVLFFFPWGFLVLLRSEKALLFLLAFSYTAVFCFIFMETFEKSGVTGAVATYRCLAGYCCYIGYNVIFPLNTRS